MEISSTTAHHQKLMATGASSQMEEVVLCNSKPRQQSPASNETQATVERKPRPHPDKAIKCPRCPSTNTKFCYYNNYSMSQPRYFCKECRRYWTEGGSLRNVPIGGGCRKNRRSSTSSSSSSSAAAASKVNKLVPEPMVLPSCTDFPNVLPTFSSTGFELPRDHLSLAFGSSSSNPAATLAPGGTFLDILRGGLLDGNHQNNDCYGPTNVMVMPPSTFCVGAGLNLMMQQHGLGGTSDPAIIGGATATQGVVNGSTDAGEEGGGGGGGVKAMMGLQWPSQFGGGVGSAGGQLQVGGQQQQQQQGTVNDNNVTMDDNNNGPSRDWYWNNGAADSGNPWQGLINSSSLI